MRHASPVSNLAGRRRPRNDGRDYAAPQGAAGRGIKEKVLAANRAGVKEVLLPRLNEPDLDDVPEEARRALRLKPVDSADEVLFEAIPERAAADAAAERNQWQLQTTS
jgi:predicted ATP-dependent protease